jgi:hypothetical protein
MLAISNRLQDEDRFVVMDEALEKFLFPRRKKPF